jgi:hypothetical protein
VCIISAIFGAADANCQGALVGDLPLMCPEFIQVTCHFVSFQSFLSWKGMTAATLARFLVLHGQVRRAEQEYMILLTWVLGLSNGYM